MDLFSNSFFDFDNNGELSADEELMGFMIFNNVMNDKSDDELDGKLDCGDDDDF